MTTQADRPRAPHVSVTDGAQRARAVMHSARIRMGRAFEAESANYLLLLGLTLFMVGFGLLMVLSSSYVSAHADGSSFFAKFFSQGSYAIIGVAFMMVISRVPRRFWQRISFLALLGSCALQALVVFTPLGVLQGGNRNWLALGPIVFQPSELMKFALILWLGTFLQRKEARIRQFGQTMVPALLVSGVVIFLILKGHDLGTTLIVGMVLFAALFFASVPLWQLALLGALAVPGVLVLSMGDASRISRISAFLDPAQADANGTGYQPQQALWGMANGGVFGVGLGNSQSKWSWLPASSTDYIYAVIGEELGMVGAVLVLLLFVALAIAILRVVRTAPSMYARVVSGAMFVWIIGQALINIAVVVGLAPGMGVPLPLISSGGTALVSTLAAVGILLSFARDEHSQAGAQITTVEK
ncbi:MAG TPA: putative lipid II flippase FtsW [Gryllotalpicola sp.]